MRAICDVLCCCLHFTTLKQYTQVQSMQATGLNGMHASTELTDCMIARVEATYIS